MLTRVLLCVLILASTTSRAQQWEWVDNSTGSGNLSYTNDVAIDSVRDVIYAVGYVDDTPNFPEIPNGDYEDEDDGFLMKYDLNGNVIFGFLIGGTGDDRIEGVAVDETSGNVFVTGYITGGSGDFEGAATGASSSVTGNHGGQDAFVAMYNVSGQLVWYRLIGTSNLDRGLDIAVNASGVYVTGVYTSSVSLSLFPLVVPLGSTVNNFVVALNKGDGSTIWNAVQGSGSDDYIAPSGVNEISRAGIIADDNNVYTVNKFRGSTYYVYDESGSLSTSLNDANGSEEDFVVTSYSNSGTHNWSTLYDNADDAVKGLDITNDCNGVYISGTLHDGSVTPSGTVISSPHDDLILAKLDKTSGNEVWVKVFDSNYDVKDYFVGIHADGYGNLYGVGRLRGTSLSCPGDFNFTAGATNSDVMIAHYHTDATFKRFEVIPSSNYSWGMSIATYKNEQYLVGGYYNNTISFGSISPSNSGNNAFIASRELQEPFEYISASGDEYFCQSEGTALPTWGDNLVQGGFFSAQSEVVFNDVNTGELDLVNSTPGGPYEITYSPPALSCSSVDYSFTIYIDSVPSASFDFVSSSFCVNESNPSPSFIANPGGTFSAPSGLSLLNSSSGKIDLANSTPGTYWLTYTTSGVCPTSDSLEITINSVPNADFGYSSASYCSGTGTIVPTYVANNGGTFSAPVGVVINTSTGAIDLNASAPGGPYSIQYAVNGAFCQGTETFDLTIIQSDDASFFFSDTAFCTNGGNVTPDLITNLGGYFFAPTGLTVSNGSTGEIEVSTSSVGGPYKLFYTTSGGACPATDSIELYIESAPNANFSYGQSLYCTGETNPLPSVSTSGGTFTASAGLVIDSSTGEIDLSTSTVGVTHTVQYLVSNASCSDSTTFTLMINQTEDASFSYAGSHFCQNDANPTPTILGTSGGTFTGPSEIVFGANPGEIDVAASVVGGPYWVIYTTPGATCPTSDSVEVYIETAPNPNFSYAQSTYCANETDPIPTISGLAGGTFSANAGLVINPTTGEIDLSASTTGTYTVQYLVSNTYCSSSSTFNLTINTIEDASFSYAIQHFCKNEANPLPIITGTTGGTFSGASGVVVSSSGEIDVASSTVGGPYWVVYTTPGSICPVSDSVQVYIEQVPDPSFGYTEATFCNNEANPVPVISGSTGGTFSASSGLVIDPTTGEIDLSSSTVGGPYTVQYLVANAYCSDSTTFDITINAAQDASFSYVASHFCQNEANPIPTITGTTGGMFTGTAGLVISSSGEIDVVASTVGGPYWVVYTTQGALCPVSDSVEVYIEGVPDAYFDYDQSSYCQGAGSTILPNESSPGGMYSAPAGIVINSGTGAINIDASTAGGPYTIERTVSNTYCQKTYTFEISIVAQDNLVSVTYDAGDYCILEGNQMPVIDGLSGGTFTAPSSIDLVSSSTGEFSPSSSTPGGPYYIQYVTSGTCPDSVETSISIFDVVSAYAGEDQELYFTFSSTLEADVPIDGVGEWATASSATFDDLIDPNTGVYDLELGENVFVWTVTNGVCPAASDEMIINVRDVFIPQAVTPNGDGKNDFFALVAPDKSRCVVQIFNRWGQLVYENSDYDNSWYGQNLKGEELMSDTYFYTIVIDDSLTYNGYVVLKK